MNYFYLKILHLVGMALFFGAGLSTAFVKVNADLTQDAKTVAFAMRHIVLADWIFTVPAGVILPVTGLLMTDWTVQATWVRWGIGLYLLTGILWLPAAFMQIRMRTLAQQAAEKDEPLPSEYWRLTRGWTALGVPAFIAAALTVYVMVVKEPLW
ncbi:MAG: DUF2269 domain-containing protein [Planctomycetota bacterium]|nr:DUF2269 domain-containing protein [Planctomycetota bacterium]